MALCETCGNEYEKSFQVILAGEKHNFDSFECARAHLRPLPMPHRELRPRDKRHHVLLYALRESRAGLI